MTKDNAKDYIPFLEALADGELQYNQSMTCEPDWVDRHEATFSHPPEFYRRRPKPVMIPFGASDFASRPVTWIRCGPCAAALVTNVTDAGIRSDSRHRTYNALRDEGWLWCDRPSQNPEDWKRCEKAAP